MIIAALCVSVDLATSLGASRYVGTSLLVAIPVACLFVGAASARCGGAAGIGYKATTLSALTAGVLVFFVWFGATVVMGGRPYDSGMVRDFHSSGGRDLATYAVNDNLGSAMMLLLLIPMLVALFGLAGARVASIRLGNRTGRNSEAPPSTR